MRLALLALAVLASAASAQTPDTLDFRGYFPLAVGNEWEYRVDITGPFGFPAGSESIRYRVVSATPGPAGDRFALAMYRSTGSGVSRDTVSVRYDEATASVLGLYTTPQNGPYETPVPFFACNLGLAFEATRSVPGCQFFYARQAEVDLFSLTGSSAPIMAKHIEGYAFGFDAVHGLGFVGGGGGCEPCIPPNDGRESWMLTFARVGGRTYGTAFVGAEAPSAAAPSVLRVSPNPARGPVAVTVAAAQPVRVAVFDALGREVAVLAGGETAGPEVLLLDVAAWPAGVYVVRAVRAAGTVASARFVVAR